MLPDPRIGIGLCAWVLGDHARARQAWQIALKRVGRDRYSGVNPTADPAIGPSIMGCSVVTWSRSPQ